ncbi:hypothetical protein Tco_1117161 [Tanacetum coccineum]
MQMLDVGRPYMPHNLHMKLIRKVIRLLAFFGHSRYVVPTGRVIVPTGRYVVPTGRYVVPPGKVIIIVSPGRLNLVPTGSILSSGRVK